MKKTPLLLLAIVISFSFGYTVKSKISEETPLKVGRVTGIGGIFFKCQNPKAVREWYQTHLGLHTNEYGAVFEWYQGVDSTKKGFSQWSPFKETTTYFKPSTKDFMINYRVDNMEVLVDDLKQNGVMVLDTIATYDYGKFVHILDIEGNKIELWEPNDVAYEQLGIQLGAQTNK